MLVYVQRVEKAEQMGPADKTIYVERKCTFI